MSTEAYEVVNLSTYDATVPVTFVDRKTSVILNSTVTTAANGIVVITFADDDFEIPGHYHMQANPTKSGVTLYTNPLLTNPEYLTVYAPL
jgi:hypothetical protein